MGKLKLKIATVATGHPSAGKIETKDRRGREGGMAIFSELKIADFPRLCVAFLIHINRNWYPVVRLIATNMRDPHLCHE